MAPDLTLTLTQVVLSLSLSLGLSLSLSLSLTLSPTPGHDYGVVFWVAVPEAGRSRGAPGAQSVIQGSRGAALPHSAVA